MVPPGPPRQYPDEPAPRRKLAPSKRGYTSVTVPNVLYDRLKPKPSETIRRLLESASVPWDDIEQALIGELGYIHRQAIQTAIASVKTAREQS